MVKNIISSYIYISGVLLAIFSCTKDEKPPGPIADIEGNIYKTVKIGNQVWMAENLKTTRYNDGTDIPNVPDSVAWSDLTTPGFCWYNNDEETYKDTYGALYNGYSVSSGNLCPSGWHVPSRDEWQQLTDFLGDTITGGGKLKEAGIAHWLTPNKNADNSSGFTALPAGIRYFEGSFNTVLYFTGIWSATEIGTDEEWYLSLYYGDAIVIMNHRSKKHGLSVRCVKE
jgi:uncharacterized protein (TIGR02145 family)